MAPTSSAAPRLVVVEDAEDAKFAAAVERVRDMRREDAEEDLASPVHERRVRGRRDMLKLLEESKEQRLLAASTDDERRDVIDAHAKNTATIEEIFMGHQKTVAHALSAAVDAEMLAAARAYDRDPYVAAPTFVRTLDEANQRNKLELGAPLSSTRVASILFRGYADVLEEGEHTHKTDVERAANMVGDPTFLDGIVDVSTWRSHGGYTHNISPQAFILDAIDTLMSGTSASSATWYFRESFACIHEFVQRVNREDFGGSALRIAHFGPGSEKKQHAAREAEKARAMAYEFRARRAAIIRSHVIESELLAALKNLETSKGERR